MLSKYNIIWDSPSKDCTGVMPIGNGDIGAGIYAIEDDALYLLLSKDGAVNYEGELYKTGRVKITISPNPFANDGFTQTLDIEKGRINIKTKTVDINIWADANFNVYNIEIRADRDIALSAVPEFWERIDGTKDVCLQNNGHILWYFNVGDRSRYTEELAQFSMEHIADGNNDPYRYTVFGNLMECGECAVQGSRLAGNGTKFDIKIYGLSRQTPHVYEWIHEMEQMAQENKQRKNTWQNHLDWWSAFWERSYIFITDNEVQPQQRRQPNFHMTLDGHLNAADNGELVSQAYTVFRFLMACQSRGKNQMKFNGGLFTQQFYTTQKRDRRVCPKELSGRRMLLHEDDRLWGGRYTFQNQRLMFWPLLVSGDFELMFPFFNYYHKLLETRKEYTKKWFGHEGAFFRENLQPTGMDLPEQGRIFPPKTKRGEKYEGWYHDYYFTCSLELVVMMINYVWYTGDATFSEYMLAPMAREVLTFYDKHYERDRNGKLVLDPAQVLETFWIAVNPAPDIAGLHYILNAVLDMEIGSNEDKQNWTRLLSELPPVPMHTVNGDTAIAPAEKYEKLENFENGELYPVFPFTKYGVGFDTNDIVENTMKNRTNPNAFCGRCWTQDQIDWAHAGNAVEARDGLIKRFRTASPFHRFPFYGRENPDSCPDFDHFGSGSIALQHMLVQETGDEIHLLPAWPHNWDVKFKLRIRNNGVVEGEVKGGKLLHWDIYPVEFKEKVAINIDWN